MKFFFKFLFTFMLIHTNNAFSKDFIRSESVQKIENKGNKFIPFPEDTTLKFIKNYGKDSLIKLIDSRIKEAKRFIKFQTIEFDNAEMFIEFFMINKHFKLGFDTSDFQYYKRELNYKSLYNIVEFDKKEMWDTLQSLGVEKVKKMLLDDAINGGANHTFMLPLYCDFLTGSNELINYLIKKNTITNLDYYKNGYILNDQVATYIEFGQIVKKCGTFYPQAISFKNYVFKNLYTTNSILSILTDTSKFDDKHPEDVNYFTSFRLLAYALYFDDINIKTHGDNLMYLFSTQQTSKDGGWKFAHYLDRKSNMYVTMYGLWALCQFKEQLEKKHFNLE